MAIEPLSRRAMLGLSAGLAAGCAMGASMPALASANTTPVRRSGPPLVIAHRGASALRPEHTLGAYAKAIQDGADFIEPDLVATKDGVLVARHENNIADTTDVSTHPEFADRRAVKMIDGQQQEGWFTEDFTFGELKTLRAKERLGAVRTESGGYDGEFQIASLEEIADFTAAEAAARGRIIGIIPEIKHPTYFAGIGLEQEPRLIDRIGKSAYLRRAPFVIQSFETANLRSLRPLISGLPNVQLAQLIGDPTQTPPDMAATSPGSTYADLLTPAGLANIAGYADYLAPPMRMVIPLNGDQRLGQPTGLVEAAHQAGLLVSAWTFRPENLFLAADFRNDQGDGARNPAGSIAEMQRYLAIGIDAIFTDDPALGRQVVDSYGGTAAAEG